jgi:hypothetical protein
MVYGFRPYRNRNSPGDPPPRWAPLGRRGCLLLAITVIAGVVIALLIGALRPGDAGQAALVVFAVHHAAVGRVSTPAPNQVDPQRQSVAAGQGQTAPRDG